MAGEEQNVGLDVAEGAGAPEQPAAPSTQPSSLAEAFAALRSEERAGAETPVSQPDEGRAADTSVGGPADGAGSDQGTDVAVAQQAPVSGDSQPSQTQSQQPAANTQQPVQRITRNTILKDLARQAATVTEQQFQEHGVHEMSMGDLYRPDEQTGRVTFVNPDDPQRPFTSRAEAQAWINAFNEDVRNEKRKFAQETYAQLQQQNADYIALADFAPTFLAMPADVQETFEALVAPYEKQLSDGTIVFPGANLNLIAQQANNIAAVNRKRAAAPAAAAEQGESAQQQSGPALDMKTGKSSTPTNKREPKTLAEAMQMVSEQKAAERKAKQK